MPRASSRGSAGAPTLRRSVADLRALAHPLRLRMMELFAETPRTTKQVAELLGQPPTRLYHHVAALERAGLLVLKEKRQNRGAVEKWYVAEAQEIRGVPNERNAAARRAGRRAVAATVLEQAKQEILSIPAGAREAALISRIVVVASPAEIPVIRKRLFESLQSLRAEFESKDADGESSAPAECERWAVTLAFTPTRSAQRTSSDPSTRRSG